MFEGFEELEEGGGLEAAEASLREDVLLAPRQNPDCPGQEEIEKALLQAVNSGALPHALIFAGPGGVGKSTMAFRLARYLLKNGSAGAAQDSLFGESLPPAASLAIETDHPVFHKVASGGHPDLLTIGRPMDEKKGVQKSSVDVETARKVTPFLRMTPSEQGGWRIVIVDDADTMNRNAQNALLKILEEPPPRVLLILIAHRAGAMIPTIRSRCRTFSFPALPRGIVLDLLRRYEPAAEPKELEMIATIAEGSIGAAIRILEEGGRESVQSVMDLLSAWPEWDWKAIHQTAEMLGRHGQDKAFLGFRDILLWVAQSLTMAKARGIGTLEAPLSEAFVPRLLAHYSLEQWSQICERLEEHFACVQSANLDRRQGVIGAFAMFE
ncbi:MAG: DNA polymerase III subunit delta' [Rhodospirillales bacterium]|nr:DNA polymerase III subunit delta' [Alphaproteobacteria bacterium]USO03356.1 MAG: DNA polymerase III subunit delta' [Rhodospirillales bacterium]